MPTKRIPEGRQDASRSPRKHRHIVRRGIDRAAKRHLVLAASCAVVLLCAGCGRDSSSPQPGTDTAQKDSNVAPLRKSKGPRHLPPLTSPVDWSSVRLTEGTGDLLTGKVVLVHFASRSSLPTSSTETLMRLHEQVSKQSSAVGIRILSLTLPESERASNVPLPHNVEGHGTQWRLGSASADLLAVLFPSFDPSDETASPESSKSRRQAIVLVDRSGRVRCRYGDSSSHSIEQILADVGQILPEFSPQQFGYATSDEAGITHLAQPPEILDQEWLHIAARRQTADLKETDVSRDFTFTNRVADSGITFDPQIVDDQRWRLLVNHYDHGNGICVADVNSDKHLDVFLVSQTGHNELYFGNGDGTFRNVTEGSGLAFPGRICVTASFADLDNDGDPDACLTCIRRPNLLLENDGHGHFTDVTEHSGMSFVGHSSAPVFFDYDRDGLLDLFLCNVGRFTTEEHADLTIDTTSSLRRDEKAPSYYVGRKDAFAGHLRPNDTEHSVLFRNSGQLTFEDVSEQTGLKSDAWSGDATPIDANNDGWPDLFVLNMQGHDEYFENQQGKRFVRKTDEMFAATSWGAMGAKSFDFDGNGLLDLFVTDMHSDMSQDVSFEHEREKSDMQWPPSFLGSTTGNIFGNAFFLQQTPGQFEEVSDEIAAENYWPWGLSAGDLNADGFIDVFLSSSMCFPYRYGINSVLLNDRGRTFQHCEFALNVEPRANTARMKPWFDVSCIDGDEQHPMCVGREGTVRVWSCLGTRSSAIFDIDEDGDLDIVTNEFNSRPQVLVSNLAQRQPEISYLKIALTGSQSNRDGLGARVTVVTNDRQLVQVHDGKSGYLSQGTAPLYFGLGKADHADEIKVEWPTGETQTIRGPIESRTLLRILEPTRATDR